MKSFKQFLLENEIVNNKAEVSSSAGEETLNTLYNRQPPPIYTYSPENDVPPVAPERENFDYNGDGQLTGDELDDYNDAVDEYFRDLLYYKDWQRDPMNQPGFNLNNPKHLNWWRKWREEEDRRQRGQEREAGPAKPEDVSQEVWDEFLQYLRRLLGGDFEFENIANDDLIRWLRDFIRQQSGNN